MSNSHGQGFVERIAELEKQNNALLAVAQTAWATANNLLVASSNAMSQAGLLDAVIIASDDLACAIGECCHVYDFLTEEQRKNYGIRKQS